MQQKDKELLRLFGIRVKSLRIKVNNSLNNFVFNRGYVSTSNQSRIENGLVDPKLSTIVKEANALGISLSELFDGFDFKYDPED